MESVYHIVTIRVNETSWTHVWRLHSRYLGTGYDKKFSSHLVPEQHRVRQATSEFKDFALIWWNELATLGLQPHTWDGFKIAMRQRFVPPSYQHDLVGYVCPGLLC
jgi:hypothetical protein